MDDESGVIGARACNLAGDQQLDAASISLNCLPHPLQHLRRRGNRRLAGGRRDARRGVRGESWDLGTAYALLADAQTTQVLVLLSKKGH